MRILHVALGLPPFRGGGLTYYALDLLKAQLRAGHHVQLLYPGRFTIGRKLHIVRRSCGEFDVFEIVNPLPIPIPFGIRDPRAFVKQCDTAAFRILLTHSCPDIIHVHTLMGIHQEFFQAAKVLGIRMIVTTHDYFGLCPKTNLVDAQQDVCTQLSAQKCASCCAGAGLPAIVIQLLQSDIYRRIKNSWPMKRLRAYKRRSLSVPMLHGPSGGEVTPERAAQYEHLRNYYRSIFKAIDRFHFNSTQSKDVYTQLLGVRGEVIPITHDGIKDRRLLRSVRNGRSTLRIGYTGGSGSYKGIGIFIEALRLLTQRGIPDWEAHLYGDDYTQLTESLGGRIIAHGGYERKDLGNVFHSMDLLVVPSICKETFGLVVLEALSHGLPVLVSENVGAKDLLADAPAFVKFQPCSEGLYAALAEIISRPSALMEYQRWITARAMPFDMDDHAKQIVQFYMRTAKNT